LASALRETGRSLSSQDFQQFVAGESMNRDMVIVNAIYVLASFSLVLAVASAWISYLSPYWLGNVTTPWPGRYTQSIEHDLSYISSRTAALPSTIAHRGLWAQCRVDCQWFWQHDYSLQKHKFTLLGMKFSKLLFFSEMCFDILRVSINEHQKGGRS
jgi:hypothetical protein